MSAVVAPTETPATRRGGILAVLLLFIPLIAGTVFATATDMDISRSWSSGGEVTGAPAPASANSQELIEARRAAGEAGAQAGFLASGTGELTAGTQELVDAATPLQEGVGAAAEGARQLHQGLIELQAGTGQMGTGATEIADGVSSAVEQMTGLVILTQQIRMALEQADRDLAAMDRPEAEQIRGQLANLKGELEKAGLDVEMTDRLDELRSGTRDLANQLAVPGYGYHDGIYTATNGAAELATGLGELEAGVGEAVAGFSALDEGASRLEAMAALNQEKTGAVQRALPAPQMPAAGVELTASGSEAQSASLPPMYAFLIATMVMLAGVALGWFTLRNRWLLAFVVLGITALGGVVVFTVALGMGAAALAGAVAVLLLATMASAVMARVLIHAFGVTGAVIAAVIGWIAQVAVVGHVWNATAVAEIGTVWQILAGLMPLHYPTFALTALGNGGTLTPVWVGVAVLGGLLIIGWVMLRRFTPAAVIEVASDNTPDREAVEEETTTPTP